MRCNSRLEQWSCARSAAAAQIKGYARNCPEKNELCVWHKAVVTPPKGWVEDETWTQRYRRIVFFENGEQSSANPLCICAPTGG